MVRTRSGLDTADEAPSRTSGCCKKFLRELVLFTLDMTILLFGVLRRPLCLWVLLALVARLGLFAGNVVAHYALAATILQNGRSAALTADEEFLTSLVNATLQPPRYRPDTQPPHHLRSKRSPGSPSDSLTSSELAVLRALLQGPNPLPSSQVVTQDVRQPPTPPPRSSPQGSLSTSTLRLPPLDPWRTIGPCCLPHHYQHHFEGLPPIPHICHKSHENSRVNFFWTV